MNASRSRSLAFEVNTPGFIGTILWRISETPRDLAFTPATGSRLHWEDLPHHVRQAIEGRLPAPVVEAVTQPGGLSPGLAARLRLADSSRLFVKAVSAARNPDSPRFHRREATIAAALPPSVPAPRFLWSYEDGEWVALAFEDINGRHPTLPWRLEELDRVLVAISALIAGLTPSPIELITIAERLHDHFRGWRRLAEAPTDHDPLDGLDPWAQRNLERLADLESGWEGASVGETLLHFDLRADNILITEDRVIFVDWPHAARGAGWLELAQILPSIAMQGGPMPWEIFDRHPLGRAAPAEFVPPVVAAISGFFIYGSRLPAPPGLPTLRALQRDQGRPALRWLKRLTGWP